MATTDGDRLAAGATRVLAVALPAVRERLLPLLRQLDFRLTVEQFSLIVAERGSSFGGLTMSPSRVPVEVRIDLDPNGSGTTVAVRVEDRWKVPLARNWGAVAVYAQVFADVLGAVDAALGRLDPDAAAGFDLWWRTFADADAADQSVASAAARAESLVSRQASRILDGPKTAQQRSAMDEAGLSTVSFVAPAKTARLQADDVDGLLTAGQLVAARPGGLPKALVKQVQDFIVTLENDLQRRASGGARQLSVAAWAVPVVSFLHQQARLRELLPMRILLVCTTCRLEKVVNPDFARMRERSRRAKLLSGSIGMVFGSNHISPYILVGKLVQMKKTDPDFVCARCQGLDADQTMITFCPQCGDRRGETVLRICPKCDFDFRKMMPATALWQETSRGLESAPVPGTAIAGSTPTEPGPVSDGAPAPAPATPSSSEGEWSPSSGEWSAPAAEWSAPVHVASSGGAPVDAGAGQWTAPATSAYGHTARSAPPEPAAAGGYPPGWYPDPWRRFQLRYYDGRTWTGYASTNGMAATDPIG